MEINPFVFARTLSLADSACPRPEEADIHAAVHNRSRLALVGDRQLGKSSLVQRTLEASDTPCLHFDLMGVNNIQGFCTAFSAAMTGFARKYRNNSPSAFSTFLQKFGLELRETRLGWGQTYASIGSRMPESTLPDLLLRLALLLENAPRPLALFFDELQVVPQFFPVEDARHVLGSLRAFLQQQHDVAVLFAGSAMPEFSAMFLSDNSPFYQGASLLRLQPLPRASLIDFIHEQYQATGRTLSDDALTILLAVAGNRSADVQRLAHEAWGCSHGGHTGLVQIKEAFTKIVGSYDDFGYHLLHTSTQHQFAVLAAIAYTQDLQLSGKETAEFAGLHTYPAQAFRRATEPFLGGQSPILEMVEGRLVFRSRWLRFWFYHRLRRLETRIPGLLETKIPLPEGLIMVLETDV